MSIKLDPRVVRTRKAFEDALLYLMKEEEFEKISVSKIAKKAHLNRATFYLHYFDKEDLLEQYLERALKELGESSSIVVSEYSYEVNNPHPMFVRVFEHLRENYKFYKIMMAHENRPQILHSVSQIIGKIIHASHQKMQRDGVQFVVSQDLSEAYMTSAYLGTIIWWLNKEMPFSPKYMAQQLTRLSTVGPFQDNPFLAYV